MKRDSEEIIRLTVLGVFAVLVLPIAIPIYLFYRVGYWIDDHWL